MKVLECPHCHIGIVVDALNCGIFRCGVRRDTGAQLDPHLSEEACRAALGHIWGCSRPFRVSLDASGVMRSAPCGYI